MAKEINRDYPVGMKDTGCELARAYLGTKKAYCQFCPWDDCIEVGERDRKTLSELYENWKDMLKWIYEERNLEVGMLSLMFGQPNEVIRRILRPPKKMGRPKK